MTFRELLEKYKNGTATEAERALVEAELEKSEAIADYLAEGLEELEERGASAEATGAEVKQVRRTVNRRLRRTALWAAAIVLAAALAVQFVVNPLVSSFYYQPNAQTVGQTDYSDATFDLIALYSLLLPGQSAGNVRAKALGFGKYALTYETEDWLTGERKQVSRTMDPGEYERRWWITPAMQKNGFDLLTMDVIARDGVDLRTGSMGQETVDYLSQLPETSYLAVWVHFPEDLGPVELAQLKMDYERYREILTFRWAAVRTAVENQLIGYQTPERFYLNLHAAPDRERYPMFSYTQLWEEMAGRSFSAKGLVRAEGQAAEQHFMTLLRYLADRPEAVEALAGTVTANGEYDFAAIRDYVEENGVEIYGALVYAQPSALLQMWEDGVIDGISIQQVLPSRYSGSREIRQ